VIIECCNLLKQQQAVAITERKEMTYERMIDCVRKKKDDHIYNAQ
jgi:hypothetical protein